MGRVATHQAPPGHHRRRCRAIKGAGALPPSPCGPLRTHGCPCHRRRAPSLRGTPCRRRAPPPCSAAAAARWGAAAGFSALDPRLDRVVAEGQPRAARARRGAFVTSVAAQILRVCVWRGGACAGWHARAERPTPATHAAASAELRTARCRSSCSRRPAATGLP
eukprot:365874-Chlamydomonas_euryale.AAC.2